MKSLTDEQVVRMHNILTGGYGGGDGRWNSPTQGQKNAIIAAFPSSALLEEPTLLEVTRISQMHGQDIMAVKCILRAFVGFRNLDSYSESRRERLLRLLRGPEPPLPTTTEGLADAILAVLDEGKR